MTPPMIPQGSLIPNPTLTGPVGGVYEMFGVSYNFDVGMWLFKTTQDVDDCVRHGEEHRRQRHRRRRRRLGLLCAADHTRAFGRGPCWMWHCTVRGGFPTVVKYVVSTLAQGETNMKRAIYNCSACSSKTRTIGLFVAPAMVMAAVFNGAVRAGRRGDLFEPGTERQFLHQPGHLSGMESDIRAVSYTGRRRLRFPALRTCNSGRPTWDSTCSRARTRRT